jgi:hypothetical protein
MSATGYPSNPCNYGSDGVNQIWFNPRQVIWLTDDFNAGNEIGGIGWNVQTATVFQYSDGSSTNPGVVQNQVGSSFNQGNHSLNNQNYVGGGQIIQEWIVGVNALSSITNRYLLNIGFISATGNSAPGTNAICFSYTDNVNSGNWICQTIAGGTPTSTTTSTAPLTSGFQRLQININPTASSVTFFINGNLVATNTTNIPASSAALFISCNVQNTGTFSLGNSGYNLDQFNHYQLLTTSR